MKPLSTIVLALLMISPASLLAADKARQEPDVISASKAAYILGADISWVQEQENQGVRFDAKGSTKPEIETYSEMANTFGKRITPP